MGHAWKDVIDKSIKNLSKTAGIYSVQSDKTSVVSGRVGVWRLNTWTEYKYGAECGGSNKAETQRQQQVQSLNIQLMSNQWRMSTIISQEEVALLCSGRRQQLKWPYKPIWDIHCLWDHGSPSCKIYIISYFYKNRCVTCPSTFLSLVFNDSIFKNLNEWFLHHTWWPAHTCYYHYSS